MHAQQAPSGPPPAVLIFLKSLATPLVLYTANTQETFQEIKEAMKLAKPSAPKLIEKETLGPLKIVFFWDTEIAGAALQMETPPPSPPPGTMSASSRLPLNPSLKAGLPPSPPSLKK